MGARANRQSQRWTSLPELDTLPANLLLSLARWTGDTQCGYK